MRNRNPGIVIISDDKDLKFECKICGQVRFWLAVLKNFDQFTKPQRKKIDKAYSLINEIYESPKPKPEKEEPYSKDGLGVF